MWTTSKWDVEKREKNDRMKSDESVGAIEMMHSSLIMMNMPTKNSINTIFSNALFYVLSSLFVFTLSLSPLLGFIHSIYLPKAKWNSALRTLHSVKIYKTLTVNGCPVRPIKPNKTHSPLETRIPRSFTPFLFIAQHDIDDIDRIVNDRHRKSIERRKTDLNKLMF